MMRASGRRGGVACSNHHFRAAKHRALDTLLWHFKIRIALEVARWSWSGVRIFCIFHSEVCVIPEWLLEVKGTESDANLQSMASGRNKVILSSECPKSVSST